MRWLPLAVAVVGVLFAPLTSTAQTSEADGPTERQAIQRRKYALDHEIRLAVGSLPLDPYQKGWSAGASYTLHFNDYVAWEIFNITGTLLTSTDLREELITFFAVSEEEFAAPRFLLTTGVELAPLYGKQTFLNGAVGHQQLLVGAYTGLAFGDRPTISDTLEDVRPMVGLGIGFRFFVTELLSVRLDVRDFLSFRRPIRTGETFEVENILALTLSASFGFGGDE